MNKETKILLGVGAIIAAYLILKRKKTVAQTNIVSTPKIVQTPSNVQLENMPIVKQTPFIPRIPKPGGALTKELIVENIPIVKKYPLGLKLSPEQIASFKMDKNSPLGPSTNDRQTNINNMFSTTDINGIIKNPNSEYNESKFDDYVRKYSITQAEIDVAKSFYPNSALTKSNYKV